MNPTKLTILSLFMLIVMSVGVWGANNEDYTYYESSETIDGASYIWQNSIFHFNTTQLMIPDHTMDYQQVHQSVILLNSSVGTISSYRYWMAFTPYANSSTLKELPNIVASNDGQNWVQPTGISNPICGLKNDEGCGSGTVADPNLIYNYDKNIFELTWVNQFSNQFTQVRYSNSTDGVNWLDHVVIYTHPINYSVAPSLIYKDNHYYLYLVNALNDTGINDPNTYLFRVNSSYIGTNSFNITDKVKINFTPYDIKDGQLKIWHPEIRFEPSINQYVGVIAGWTLTNSDYQYLIGYSDDGINFSVNKNPLLTRIFNPSSVGIPYLKHYKPSLLYDDLDDKITLYSSNNDERQGSGYGNLYWWISKMSISKEDFDLYINRPNVFMSDEFTFCYTINSKSSETADAIFSSRAIAGYGSYNVIFAGRYTTNQRFLCRNSYNIEKLVVSTRIQNEVATYCITKNSTNSARHYTNGIGGTIVNDFDCDFIPSWGYVIGGYNSYDRTNISSINYPFEGDIYNIISWNRTLTPSEILTINTTGKSNVNTVHPNDVIMHIVASKDGLFDLKSNKIQKFVTEPDVFLYNFSINTTSIIDEDLKYGGTFKWLGSGDKVLTVTNTTVNATLSGLNSVHHTQVEPGKAAGTPNYIDYTGTIQKTIASGERMFILNYATGQPRITFLSSTISDIDWELGSAYLEVVYAGTGTISTNNMTYLAGEGGYYDTYYNGADTGYIYKTPTFDMETAGTWLFSASLYSYQACKDIGDSFSEQFSEIFMAMALVVVIVVAGFVYGKIEGKGEIKVEGLTKMMVAIALTLIIAVVVSLVIILVTTTGAC